MSGLINSSRLFYHIARLEEWQASEQGVYIPTGFESEGFIHLSFATQLAKTYNRYYEGQTGLALLTIRLNTVSFGNLKVEDLTGRGEVFPHLYAPLTKAEVTAVQQIPSEGGAAAAEFFSRVMASEAQSN